MQKIIFTSYLVCLIWMKTRVANFYLARFFCSFIRARSLEWSQEV